LHFHTGAIVLHYLLRGKNLAAKKTNNKITNKSI